MTQSRSSSRAEAKRREQEWLAAQRRREEQLQAMPDGELDALVAVTVFNDPDLGAVPFSTSWDGFGRIVEHMRENGYTLLCRSFEPSHLDRMRQVPSLHDVRPAEVTVVDIRRRSLLPEAWPQLCVYTDTLPRAAAIAAVLTREIEQGQLISPALQPEPAVPKTGRSEDRRRQKSEASDLADGAGLTKHLRQPVGGEAIEQATKVEERIGKIAMARAEGLSDRAIAAQYGISEPAIWQFRRRHGIRLDGTVIGISDAAERK